MTQLPHYQEIELPFHTFLLLHRSFPDDSTKLGQNFLKDGLGVAGQCRSSVAAAGPLPPVNSTQRSLARFDGKSELEDLATDPEATPQITAYLLQNDTEATRETWRRPDLPVSASPASGRVSVYPPTVSLGGG